MQLDDQVSVVAGQGQLEARQRLLKIAWVYIRLRTCRACHGDGVIPIRMAVARVIQGRLSLQDEVDFYHISATGFARHAMIQVALPPHRSRFVGRRHHLHKCDQSVRAALTNLNEFLAMLFAHHGNEQGLLGDIATLADPRPIPIHQARQHRLI